MDATEDRDALVQTTSAYLISEIQNGLPKLLFTRTSRESGQRTARRLVRYAAVNKIAGWLDSFQAWPQLLDRSLASILDLITDAFLQSLAQPDGGAKVIPRNEREFLITKRHATCRLLYALCKIRGVQVLTRFFDNEPKNLEPILRVLEANVKKTPSKDGHTELEDIPPPEGLTWEEKFVCLLWLSHLALTPFDLKTVGGSSGRSDELQAKNLELPAEMPPIALRLINVSARHLASASREQGAAVKLLVRLSLRPDMMRMSLHESLIMWALSSLQEHAQDLQRQTPYAVIGYLSLIAGIVKSAKAQDIKPFLLHIFKQMLQLTSDESSVTLSSAMARKQFIKIYREISLSALRLDSEMSTETFNIKDYVLEEVVDHLLNALADKDTPVRYAASKAVSVIATRLDAAMAADITEAISGSLDENVFWKEKTTDRVSGSTKERDLTSVDPLRWHGLTLALAQLLFQRSPPPSQLPPIINSLLSALSFEQRSSTGVSIGSNVRDAACFGIWSIARKYTTDELQAVDVSDIHQSGLLIKTAERESVLQILANELVVSASLDPVGNIRRGASAALQELIGRHPNTIVQGISVVQVVDYHAVALRARACQKVGAEASKLHKTYWVALVNSLLGWRGIRAADALSRRFTAKAIGILAHIQGDTYGKLVCEIVWDEFKYEPRRNRESRHGLQLALSALLETEISLNKKAASEYCKTFWAGLEPPLAVSGQDVSSEAIRPELAAEGACRLISALMAFQFTYRNSTPALSKETFDRVEDLLSVCLTREQDIVVDQASEAAKNTIRLLDPKDAEVFVQRWLNNLRLRVNAGSAGTVDLGFLQALGSIYSLLMETNENSSVAEAILNSVLLLLSPKSSTDNETRVAAIKTLSVNMIPSGAFSEPVIDTIKLCLQDYTIDRRGDVGSLVRLEAIAAVDGILSTKADVSDWVKLELARLVGCLAAEKLDKIRFRAWLCLQKLWSIFDISRPDIDIEDANTTATKPYYSALLMLFKVKDMQIDILRGFMSSAGGGSESVLRASRSAVASYLSASSDADKAAFLNMIIELMRLNATSERVIQPTLEVVAFILQSGLFRDVKEGVKWKTLFFLVAKAHFKSTSYNKLVAAIDIYTELAFIPSLKGEVLKKLTSMLLHPMAKIRDPAAEALYMVTNDQEMLTVDWTSSPKELKLKAEELKTRTAVTADA